MTSEPNLMILVLCVKSFCTGQQISRWSCHMHLVRRWMLLELPQVNCCRNTKWNAFINAGWATNTLYFPILKFQFLLTEDNTRVNWCLYWLSWVDVPSWKDPHMAKGCGLRKLPPTLQEPGNAQPFDVSPPIIFPHLHDLTYAREELVSASVQ
jgi:hypothetical protein